MTPTFLNEDCMTVLTTAECMAFDLTICHPPELCVTDEYFGMVCLASKNVIVRHCGRYLPYLGKTDCFFLWKNEVIFTDFKHNGNIKLIAKNEEELYDSIMIQYGLLTGKSLKGGNILVTHGREHKTIFGAHNNDADITICETNKKLHEAGKELFAGIKTQLLLF